MKIFGSYQQTEPEIEKRIRTITGAGQTEERAKILTEILGMIDLTTLEGNDTTERIEALCHKAVSFPGLREGLPTAAAVCVYPSLVKVARRSLSGYNVNVASVAGGFPAGQTSLKVKLDEVRFAMEQGAEEIDMVISRGKLMEGKDTEVFDEIAAIKDICGNLHLKVILETGELKNIELIRKASALAILAGADFIKTSTGKISEGATLRAFLIMLDTVREYHEKTGRAIGLKPAGGIRKAEDALHYFLLTRDVLGSQWLNKDYLRIGASSLADDLVEELKKA